MNSQVTNSGGRCDSITPHTEQVLRSCELLTTLGQPQYLCFSWIEL